MKSTRNEPSKAESSPCGKDKVQIILQLAAESAKPLGVIRLWLDIWLMFCLPANLLNCLPNLTLLSAY